MKKTITILFLFCSIISFGQISAARKLLLAQEYKYPVLAEMGVDNHEYTASIIVDLPSSKAIGDLVIISIHGTNANLSTPTGWGLVSAYQTATIRHLIIYKFINGTEGNNVSIFSPDAGYKFAKSFLYKNASSINFVSATGFNYTNTMARSMQTNERTLTCWYGVVIGATQLTSSSSPGVLITSKTPYEEFLQLMTLSNSSALGIGIKEGKITWLENLYSNMVLFEISN